MAIKVSGPWNEGYVMDMYVEKAYIFRMTLSEIRFSTQHIQRLENFCIQ